MSSHTVDESFRIPGLDVVVRWERDGKGRLRRMSLDGRVVVEDRGGERLYDGGWVRVREVSVGGTLLRHVAVNGDRWIESYERDELGRPVTVDDTVVERDDDGRVVACVHPTGAWRYRYRGGDLVRIETPDGQRCLETGQGGRPERYVQGPMSRLVEYTDDGVRKGNRDPPDGWHLDGLGRLWAVRDATGRLRHLYLWDRFECLARIDGGPTDPLAAVFSLDATGTPVRVIGRDGVTRIPRDAFGESLLGRRAVPGLHGGAVNGGYVYYRSRRLDPVVGAYDRPDPFHGQVGDPRRGQGYSGPLLVEDARPYAVCSNDPVGRLDPTGEMSFWVGLSQATWSLQTTLFAWLLMDGWLNLFGSLFSGNLDRFGSSTGLSAKHSGILGVRRSGIPAAPNNVWTVSNIVWSNAEEFDDLAVTHAFVPTETDPGKVPELTQYGTLLLLDPKQTHDGEGLDTGQRTRSVPTFLRAYDPGPFRTAARSWTRAGGRAAPVFPGSRVPHFPAGGLHLDSSVPVPAPQDATLLELRPAGGIEKGTIGRQARVSVSGTIAGIAAGQLFVVEATAGALQILTVSETWVSGGSTHVLFTEGGTLGGGVARVIGIGAKVAGPALKRRAAPALHLEAVTPAILPYVAGDVLRVRAGAHDEIVVVDRLETALRVSAALPKNLNAHATVVELAPVGKARPAKRTADGKKLTYRLKPGDVVKDLPSKGTYLLVDRGGTKIPVRTVATVDGHGVEVDRELGGAKDDPLKVTLLDPRDEIGSDAKSPGDDTVTFTAKKLGTTPVPAWLVVRSGSDHHLRGVKTKISDVLVLDRASTAGAGTSLTVERHPARKTKFSGRGRTLASVWHFTRTGGAAAAPKDTKAVVVLGFPSLTPVPVRSDSLTVVVSVAGSAPKFDARWTVAGQTTPRAGQVVRLDTGSGAGVVRAVGLVRRICLNVTLDRSLPVAAGTSGLAVFLVRAAGPTYQARAVSATQVVVEPVVKVGATSKRVEFPRIRVGDVVEVDGKLLSVGSGTDGNLLKLTNGPNLTGTFPRSVTVRRMDAAPPAGGTPLVGRNGSVPVPATRNKIRFDVWVPNHVTAGAKLVVVGRPAPKSPEQAFPAVVASVDSTVARIETTDTVKPGPGGTLATPDESLTLYSGTIRKDRAGALILGADVVADPGIVATGTDVLVVPYVSTKVSVEGHLSPGTVKVPDRLDDASDLTRYESLVEHELHHTLQQAQLGPLLLALIPTWAIELVGDLVGGQERARMQGHFERFLQSLELTSLGGIMNLTVGSTYAGLMWLVTLAYHGVKNIFTSDDDPFDPFDFQWFPATVPDPKKPSVVKVGPVGGDKLDLKVGQRVIVRGVEDGSNRYWFLSNRYDVKEVAGDLMTLSAKSLPVSGAERDLLVAATGLRDSPLDTVDTKIMNGLGMGWMTAVFDPYGQLDLRSAPKRGSAWDVVLRVGRYAFGSKSWSWMPPAMFGIAFWDNLRRQWGDRVAALNWMGDKPHLASMEKGASLASGDTYYPVGLLRADGPAAKELEDKVLFVGDVVRYWFGETGGNRNTGTVVRRSEFAAPGVHLRRVPVVMPYFRPAVPATGSEPNRGGATSSPASRPPGNAVADVFTAKPPVDPTLTPAAFYDPSPRGWLPTRAALERTSGVYVAFTAPSTANRPHRVTLADGEAGQAGQGREAMEELEVELIHDLEVKDVTVRVGGRLVVHDREIVLLPYERALVKVEPGGGRKYNVALMQPGKGTLRRVGGDLSVHARTNGAAAAEPAEIVRVYEHGPKGFAGETLSAQGMHLPETVEIPVRRFTVKVDPALPMRASRDVDKAGRKEFRPGERAHLLVPVRVVPSTSAKQNPVLTVTYVGTRAPDAKEPLLALSFLGAGDLDAVKDHLKFGGRLVELPFPADDPPEQETDVRVQIQVGKSPDVAAVTASCKLKPHFTLGRKGGATGPFEAKKGGPALVLRCSGGVRAGAVTASPSDGVTVTVSGPDVTVKVTAAAASVVAILVADKAKPGQKARRMVKIVP